MQKATDKKASAPSATASISDPLGLASGLDAKSSGTGGSASVLLGDGVVKAKKPARSYVRIKILSVGDGGVGKSCLIKRYCEEKFVARYISTIGVDFGVRAVVVDGAEVKVNFWDLSGHSEFAAVRTDFYRDTQGLLLCYDVTSRKSFTALDGWLKEAAKHACKPLVTFCVANKTDLTTGAANTLARVVTEAEGRQWAASRGFGYFETSASSGQNVNDMFVSLFAAVVKAAPKF